MARERFAYPARRAGDENAHAGSGLFLSRALARRVDQGAGRGKHAVLGTPLLRADGVFSLDRKEWDAFELVDRGKLCGALDFRLHAKRFVCVVEFLAVNA